MNDGLIDIILNHKALDTLDTADEKAIEAFLTPFSALIPSTKDTTPEKKPAGIGGSPSGETKTTWTLEQVAAKSNDAQWLKDNWDIAQPFMAGLNKPATI